MGFIEQMLGMETPPTLTPYRRNLSGMGPRGGGPDPAEVQRSKWVQNSAKAVHDALMISPEQAYELKLANRRREKLTEGGLYRQASAMGLKEEAEALIPEMFGAGTMKRVGGKLAHELGSAYKSRLKPAIEAMTQENMLPAQAQGHFNKFPGGVGKDELEYTGVQGMIDAGQPVTKTGLLDQYNANPLQINDVVKGGPQPYSQNRLAQLENEYNNLTEHAIDSPVFGEGKYDEMIKLQNIRDQSTTQTLYAEADEAMRAGQIAQKGGNKALAEQHFRHSELLNTRAEKLDLNDLGMTDPPKYAGPQTTLPGGEDYRELLMTTPTGMQKYDARLNEVRAAHGKAPNEAGYGNWATEAEIADLNRLADKAEDANYTSSHYYEPNILAHARYNTRNIDGDKTLFIEEIQSDWHQAGRKQGYSGDEIKWAKDENMDVWIPEKGPVIKIERIAPNGKYQVKSWGGIREIYNTLEDAKESSAKTLRNIGAISNVPDAPYKATDKWQNLAFQRTVKEAVDQGHDRIAWTPGDVQADRYDLSKQVDRVIYNGEGGHMNVYGKNDDLVYSKKTTPEGIDEVVGKEIGEKIRTQLKDDPKSNPRIEGLDLKVGGEGMKSFYDKMMVKTANKFGKKYGAKVEVKGMDKTATAQPNGNGYFEVVDQKGEELTTPFDTMAEADAYVKNMKGQEVWSMKITPEMKKAMAGGVALSGLGIINMPGLGGEE